MREAVCREMGRIVACHQLNLRLHTSYLYVVDELMKRGDMFLWDELDVRTVMETFRVYANAHLPYAEHQVVLNIMECILESRIQKQRKQNWWKMCCQTPVAI
jgi:7-keto-8-aminopelargonate synthetase-like enzyme